MKYAGCKQYVFTDNAIDKIYQISNGIPRMINRVCEKKPDVCLSEAETADR